MLVIYITFNLIGVFRVIKKLRLVAIYFITESECFLQKILVIINTKEFKPKQFH